MAQLKVPSLQHLVRHWSDDPIRIKKSLLQLTKSAPPFSYGPLYDAVRDMLVYEQMYDQIISGFHRAIKRPFVLTQYLSIMPRLRDHFSELNPDFVHAVEPRYYPVARDLMVPFSPPLLFGQGGTLYFPWFIFWRDNPIIGDRLSLFVSIVDHVLLQDPDLENAKFQIFDLSAKDDDGERSLKIIDAAEVPRLTDAERVAKLAVFAEGYFLAKAESDAQSAEKSNSDTASSTAQRLLFKNE